MPPQGEITERDIIEALTQLGDDVLDAYRRGALSRYDAQRIAARRRQQEQELGSWPRSSIGNS